MRAESASTIDVLVVVAARDPLDQRGRRRQLPFPDVEQHEHGFLGQEPEAPDGLLLVGVEAEIADGLPGFEAFVQALEDDLLAFGRFALRGRPMAPAALQPFQPPLGHREIGEDELEIESFEVARRVDAAVRMRVRGVLERPHDVQERVRVAQAGQVVGRQLLGADVALGRGRRGRQVRVGHDGMHDLLGLEDLGEPVQASVGHLDDADVERDPTEAAGLGMASGQGVEDGRLARSGKPDDGGLHVTDRSRSAGPTAEAQ